MTGTPVRIAMWSGPRNISTALMRSWGNRADTVVCDEPLYAHYLDKTGLMHPGRREVLSSQVTDWRRVVEALIGEVPGGKAIYYQKHMAHHLLPNIERDWVTHLRNAFLIRDPGEMLVSLTRVTPRITIDDTGLPQQWELYRQLGGGEDAPPVIDARDVLMNPAALLTKLCGALDVPYDAAMLSWPAGPRESDGVWAKHWYGAVESSTGFQPYRPREVTLTEELEAIRDRCHYYYDRLHEARLTA